MPAVRTVLGNGAKFILCAVPGAFILLILPLLIVARAIGPARTGAIGVVVGIAAVPIGAALILYGTNNWGKWGYVLPIVAVLPLLLAPPQVHTIVSIALLALPFVAAWGVRKYYRTRANVQRSTTFE